jgi:alpha-L-arabinofuranosidase
MNFESESPALAISCVRDSGSGEVILKIVSRAETPVQAQVDLSTIGALASTASCTVLSGDPMATDATAVCPISSEIPVEPRFTYEVPAHSLSVIRVKPQGAA